MRDRERERERETEMSLGKKHALTSQEETTEDGNSETQSPQDTKRWVTGLQEWATMEVATRANQGRPQGTGTTRPTDTKMKMCRLLGCGGETGRKETAANRR
jgi:hypothetical protein